MIPTVRHLAETWASVDTVCTPLGDSAWLESALPGWTVQDVLSHLVDYEARALGRPAPEHTPALGEHVRNPIGEHNEVGVDYRRALPGAAVLDEFRAVTAARLEHLARLTRDDLAQPAETPVGAGTFADVLAMRLMDTWIHEQDIREALAVPGHAGTAATGEVVAYFGRFFPYVVGKKAAAPEGATAVLAVAPHPRAAVQVRDGRARPLEIEDVENPSVTIETDARTYVALSAGRAYARHERVTITGDRALGQRIVAGLPIMV